MKCHNYEAQPSQRTKKDRRGTYKEKKKKKKKRTQVASLFFGLHPRSLVRIFDVRLHSISI